MPGDSPTASDRAKRAMRKRSKRPADQPGDDSKRIGSVPPEEKSFRTMFLCKETGIDHEQARGLVDSIEANGAALLHAARRLTLTSND